MANPNASLDLFYDKLLTMLMDVLDAQTSCSKWKSQPPNCLKLGHILDTSTGQLHAVLDFALSRQSFFFSYQERQSLRKKLSIDPADAMTQGSARILTEWALSEPARDEKAHWEECLRILQTRSTTSAGMNAVIAIVDPTSKGTPFIGSILAFLVAHSMDETKARRASFLVKSPLSAFLNLEWAYRNQGNNVGKVGSAPNISILAQASLWLNSQSDVLRGLRADVFSLLCSQARTGLNLAHFRRNDSQWTHQELALFVRIALQAPGHPSVEDIRLPHCVFEMNNAGTPLKFDANWQSMITEVLHLLQEKPELYMFTPAPLSDGTLDLSQRRFLSMMGGRDAKEIYSHVLERNLLDDVRIRVFGETHASPDPSPSVDPSTREPNFTPELYELNFTNFMLKSANNKGIYGATMKTKFSTRTEQRTHVVKVLCGLNEFNLEMNCLNLLHGHRSLVRVYLAGCLNDRERAQLNQIITKRIVDGGQFVGEGPMDLFKLSDGREFYIPPVDIDKEWYYIVFEQCVPLADALSRLHAQHAGLHELPLNSITLRSNYVRLCLLYLWHMACGLDTLRAAGVVHRDLAFRNILTTGHRAVLCDFGLALRHIGPFTPEPRDAVWNGVNSTVHALWPPIVPPEVVRGAQYTPESDLYQFALLMYVVLSGGPLMPKVYHMGFNVEDLNDIPDFLNRVAKLNGSELRPDLERLNMYYVPHQVISFIQTLWAPRPLDRLDPAFPSLAARLERVICDSYATENIVHFADEVIRIFFSAPNLTVLTRGFGSGAPYNQLALPAMHMASLPTSLPPFNVNESRREIDTEEAIRRLQDIPPSDGEEEVPPASSSSPPSSSPPSSLNRRNNERELDVVLDDSGAATVASSTGSGPQDVPLSQAASDVLGQYLDGDGKPLLK